MVSIIIPSYNRENTIIRSVESVLHQTYPDIEVIIVDDGSTDSTLSMLNSIDDDRLIIIHQDHKGACAARNKGIEVARGQYIAFHDSDDTCRPNRIEMELNALLENDADFICGNVLTHMNGKMFVAPNKKSGWLTNFDDMFNITTMTFLGKASVFKNYHFDPMMPRWQDLDLLLSICGKVSIYFCQEIMCDYYREGDSMSLNPSKCIAAYEMMTTKYPEIKERGGYLYSKLTKMYADSKVALNQRDYYHDYLITFKNNRTIVNLIWLLFARSGHANILYNYLHQK